jgi:NAD(P)-dependent dehydrogenase (short-subunit alcohol dehydrogenase family)
MGWSEKDVPDLSGRRVLVTGANSGVGLEATRMLLTAGADVVLGCRDRARAEAALRDVQRTARGTGSVLLVDVSDLDSVAAAAGQVLASTDRLDALVDNAGVMGGSRRLSPQGYERQMATNHLGHFAFAARLWPLLTSSTGRLVTVSSTASRAGQLSAAMTREDLVDPQPYRAVRVYANTKQANLLFAVELDRRARRARAAATSVAAHPGTADSNLFPRQLREQGLGWFAPIAVPFARAFVMQSTRDGALPLVRAAVDPTVPPGALVGPRRLGHSRGAPEILEVYRQGRDEATATRLWELSEELTGVRFEVT